MKKKSYLCKQIRQSRSGAFSDSTNNFSMKHIAPIALLLAAALAMPMTMQAKKDRTANVYLFGLGRNFNDSTVYLIPAQLVSGISFEKRTKFLNGRTELSAQMRDFLSRTYGEGHYTCTVFYSDNKKAIEKKYMKIRRLQANNSELRLQEVPGGTFTFVVPSAQQTATGNE